MDLVDRVVHNQCIMYVVMVPVLQALYSLKFGNSVLTRELMLWRGEMGLIGEPVPRW